MHGNFFSLRKIFQSHIRKCLSNLVHPLFVFLTPTFFSVFLESVACSLKSISQLYLQKLKQTFNVKKIIFLPVSATGCSPVKEPPPEPEKEAAPSLENLDLGDLDLLGEDSPSNPDGYGHFRAGDINPIWAENAFADSAQTCCTSVSPAGQKIK